MRLTHFNFRTMNFLEISGILFWALIGLGGGLYAGYKIFIQPKIVYKEIIAKGVKRCVEDVN